MRLNRLLTAAALLLPLLSPALLPGGTVEAQVYTVTTAPRGMLGIMTQAVPRNAANARQREIVSVVPESPAHRAGLVAGDTIVRINGLAATQQIMNTGFEPGDTVVLRVVRNGRERDVTVVAAERTIAQAEYVLNFSDMMLPDSVRGRISILMDAMRADMDTLRGRVFSFSGDTTIVYGLGGDSARFMYRRVTPMQVDSMARGFMLPRGEWRGPVWSADSVFGLRGEFPGVWADSMFGRGGAIYHFGDGGFRFDSDSIRFMRPTEFMASGFVAGLRAVAGAELSELNPGLAEYFGTTSGVLVLNAREGTPAARAGLMAGDVILRANDVDVASIEELRRAIARARGEPSRLDVLRRGQRLTITMGESP